MSMASHLGHTHAALRFALPARAAVALALLLGLGSEASAQWRLDDWDWAWGELLYGHTYATKLTVTNKCKAAQTVDVWIEDPIGQAGPRGRRLVSTKRGIPLTLDKDAFYRVTPEGEDPFEPGEKWPLSARVLLSIPAGNCSGPPASGPHQSFGQTTRCKVSVNPGENDLEVIIKTPPPPDLSGVILPPGFDPNELYDEVQGKLTIRGPDANDCHSEQDNYWASGHVHLDPDPPKPTFGGAPPTCEEWWEGGTRPPALTRDCTTEFRRLASAFRQDPLGPFVERSPDAWAWLPSVEQIQEMFAADLLAMKARAEAQMGSER
jgi:hypothetical protein